MSVSCDEAIATEVARIAAGRGESIGKLVCQLLRLIQPFIILKAIPEPGRSEPVECGKRKVLQFRVPVDLYDEITVLAEENGKRFTDVVRMVVRLAACAGPKGKLVVYDRYGGNADEDHPRREFNLQQGGDVIEF